MRARTSGIGLAAILAGCSPLKSEAQEAVKRLLNDPESAQFRNVESCPSGNGMRGEVNAKNLYGGYVGFKPFFYVDHRAVMIDSDDFIRAMNVCYGDRTGSQNSASPTNATDDLDNAAADLEAAAKAVEDAASNVQASVGHDAN